MTAPENTKQSFCGQQQRLDTCENIQMDEAAKKTQQNKKQKNKNRRHWGTQIGGPQHDNLLTLKEANTEV